MLLLWIVSVKRSFNKWLAEWETTKYSCGKHKVGFNTAGTTLTNLSFRNRGIIAQNRFNIAHIWRSTLVILFLAESTSVITEDYTVPIYLVLSSWKSLSYSPPEWPTVPHEASDGSMDFLVGERFGLYYGQHAGPVCIKVNVSSFCHQKKCSSGSLHIRLKWMTLYSLQRSIQMARLFYYVTLLKFSDWLIPVHVFNSSFDWVTNTGILT